MSRSAPAFSRLPIVALAALLAVAAPLEAQGLRGWTATHLRYVEVRALDPLDIPFDQVEVGPDGGFVYQGIPVSCVPEVSCTALLPGAVESAVTGNQDLGFTAWGLGMESLSVTALLRGRADLGGDFTWPRSDDAFDALLAYAQLTGDGWRVRAGRQETFSGLGFSGYDGVSGQLELPGELRVEGYGGRSLARGLNEPRHEALRGIEDFIPDESAWLVGGFLSFRPEPGTNLGLRYQREIWADRSGLISERASLDLHTDLLRPFRLDGSVDWDVALDRVGKASVELQWMHPGSGLVLAAEGRRYLPYFELSTIWGLFNPVAYHEALLRASWTLGPVAVWGTGGYRSYEDPEAPVIFSPTEDDGWRGEGGASLRVAPEWTVEGGYRVEWGVGAFLSSGDATVRFRPSERLGLAATGMAFQQIDEFRVGDGRVYGGGLSVDARITDDVTLDGGLNVFRQDPGRGDPDEIWNQTRGWLAVRVDFGEDPARRTGGLRR